MQAKPFFSIILTTYNAESFIRRTVDSILGQIGRGEKFDFELLVVDDKSKDSTVEILDQLNIDYKINELNSGGPNKGRNICLKKAKGSHIIICDHDDQWHENRLEVLTKYLLNAEVISSGYLTIKDERTREDRAKKGDLYLPHGKAFHNILEKNYSEQVLYLGALCFQNNNIPFFEEKYNRVDIDWILAVLKERDTFYVDQCLYSRFVDGSNLSHVETYRLQDLDIFLDTIDSYKEEFPERHQSWKKNRFETIAKYYYIKKRFQKSREYFMKSPRTLKNLFYFLSTYAGSQLVNRYFKVFD